MDYDMDQIVKDVMIAFDIADEDTVIDGIQNVVNNSDFTADDYGMFFRRSGELAASMGIEFNDFNTEVMIPISALFSSGGDAGHDFNDLLKRLRPISYKAMKNMKALGLFGKYKSVFLNEEGRLKPIRSIRTDLHIIQDMPEAQRPMTLIGMFGVLGSRSAYALSDI